MGKPNQAAWKLVKHYQAPIQCFFDDDQVTEICINSYKDIFVEKNGKLEKTDVRFESEEELSKLIIQLGNTLDQAVCKDNAPVLDARLEDGSRVCAVLAPYARNGSCMSVRVFPKTRLTSSDLVGFKSITEEMMEFIRLAILARQNTIISGGTGTGKTTLLNVTSSFIPREDRVLVAEDTGELNVDVPNIVYLEAPQKAANKDRIQHVDLPFFVKTALRKRPDRIIVGEIRDPGAATAFLQAINTGHEGCSTSIHANNPIDAMSRIESLVAGAGELPYEVVKSQVRANIHLIVQAKRTPKWGRKIDSLAEIIDGEVVYLWRFDHAKGHHVAYEENIARSRILEEARMMGFA